MRVRCVFVAAFLAGIFAESIPARAQQEGTADLEEATYERLDLRVSQTGPGPSVVVDRGRRDRVEVGDRVFFYPRGGGVYRGTVHEVRDRSAVVELHERGFVPVAGTRGWLLIPRSRLVLTEEPEMEEEEEPREAQAEDRPVEEDPPEPVPEPEPAIPQPISEHPGWQNEDREWSSDQPLLAAVQPVRPEERKSRVSGRIHSSGDTNWTTDHGRSDALLRTGVDLRYENPFGRGGTLQFDAEFHYRAADDPRERDESDLDFRPDRFSYSIGGTRFAPTRWEFGRFLQYGMPEFGVLDGVEWNRRRKNGDRYGASVGFMPEPDADFDTGDDFQVAAYYEWVADNREQFTVSGGIQKTFHDGTRDRDLLIGKVRYLPLTGWDFHGQLWVDLYANRDRAKGSGLEITQALFSTSRTWESGNGVDVTLRRVRFPELKRKEFLPVTLQELARNRYDRLSVSGWRWMAPDRRLHGQAGVWDDEDDSGADAELGLDVEDLIGERSRTDFTVFTTKGQFETLLGARAVWSQSSNGGRWEVLYEIADHKQEGFSSNFDDILQHRLRVSRDFHMPRGWTFSLYGEGGYWDEDGSISAGFYLNKSF